jgi:CRISPR-associated protein (TIGR02584 family)
MNVLIALLGHTPGAVTGAYYTLARDIGTPIDHVVTISTKNADSAEEFVLMEFDQWRREGHALEYGSDPYILPEWNNDANEYRKAIAPYLRDATRLRLPDEDVNEPTSVECFRELLRTLLTETYRQDEVHISVAGGRKSMAAIATLAAQLYGYSVMGLYHLYVQPEVPGPRNAAITLRPEVDGTVEGLRSLYPDEQRRLLRPEPGETQLVPISFFRLTQEGKLELRGQMQGYLVDYLVENEGLFEIATHVTNDKVIAYIFEEKVADHLRASGKWTTVIPRAYKDWFRDENGKLADIDVWAENDQEILVCECKHKADETKSVEKYKFEQAQARLKKAREQFPKKAITAWVISNAYTTVVGSRNYMLDPEYPVQFRRVKLSGALRRTELNKWITLLREPWLVGDFEELPPPEEVAA